ncbi:hypothetical protein AXF42_Ash015870 [Apostasia shenzhenica]|uniref:Uncharacterized protein n=1 Tax=Apostasia shenzhenica TaxID=1088818 RepID=A0A2H9ZXV2_9ASPA|nr:hypothetical protein AXF42_Ash015870 [Apostasia shenzhenica]
MSMAADSNANFHHGLFPPSFCNQHVVSFQSGGTNSTAGINSPGGNSSTGTMMLTGNPSSSNNTAPMMFQGNSQGNLFLEPMAGLKHDTGLAVDWSYKEQAILNHGLLKGKNMASGENLKSIIQKRRLKTKR